MPPNPHLYKPVGFNDQDLIKEMMVLMEQIPASVALNPQLARKNSVFANKLRRLKSGLSHGKAASGRNSTSRGGDPAETLHTEQPLLIEEEQVPSASPNKQKD